MLFASEESRGQYLFHYTLLSTALEKILPSLELRFGRFSHMRRNGHLAARSSATFGEPT
jgi:hypothetical protein